MGEGWGRSSSNATPYSGAGGFERRGSLRPPSIKMEPGFSELDTQGVKRGCSGVARVPITPPFSFPSRPPRLANLVSYFKRLLVESGAIIQTAPKSIVIWAAIARLTQESQGLRELKRGRTPALLTGMQLRAVRETRRCGMNPSHNLDEVSSHHNIMHYFKGWCSS